MTLEDALEDADGRLEAGHGPEETVINVARRYDLDGDAVETVNARVWERWREIREGSA